MSDYGEMVSARVARKAAPPKTLTIYAAVKCWWQVTAFAVPVACGWQVRESTWGAMP